MRHAKFETDLPSKRNGCLSALYIESILITPAQCRRKSVSGKWPPFFAALQGYSGNELSACA